MTDDACLRCPWHAALHDAGTGVMVRGPQRAFKGADGRCDDRRSITEDFPGQGVRRGDLAGRVNDSRASSASPPGPEIQDALDGRLGSVP